VMSVSGRGRVVIMTSGSFCRDGLRERPAGKVRVPNNMPLGEL
jgi:hypothetical protein